MDILGTLSQVTYIGCTKLYMYSGKLQLQFGIDSSILHDCFPVAFQISVSKYFSS